MTMPRYDALQRFWADVPPADVILAVQHGVGKFAKKSEARPAPDRRGLFKAPQKAPSKGFDERGFPLRADGTRLPPTLDEKPGTLQDLAKMLKRTKRKSIAF